MKSCPICGEGIKKNIRSHLIPKWTMDKEDRGSAKYIDMKAGITRTRPGSGIPYEVGLICEACENLSAENDRYAASYFKKENRDKIKLVSLDDNQVFIFDFNVLKIRRFIIWTILRFYFSKEYSKGYKYLDTKHIEYLKTLIVKDNLSDELNYLSYILYEPKLFSQGFTFPTFPEIVKNGDVWAFQFDISPFRFIQHVSSHTSNFAKSIKSHPFSYLHFNNSSTVVFPYKANLHELVIKIKATSKLGKT